MASANISLSEEHFQCSICLNVFTEPVTTPCGHNYCKSCIAGYWTSSGIRKCPRCNETFFGDPQLRVNTEFRDILELFKRKRAAGEEGGCPARPGDVTCDLCRGVAVKALKSCLVCLASYCDAHLEPHHTVQALKWHKLIEPMRSLEERVCKKHNKLKKFFCSEDQSCICTDCLRDEHLMHKVVSVEDEIKKRRTKVKNMQRKVNQTLSQKRDGAKSIENSVKRCRLQVEEIKAEVVKSLDGVVFLIQTQKLKLIELLEEKQKAAERQAKEHLRRLQSEIAENRLMSAELEELSKTEDDFSLLRVLPSVPSSVRSFLNSHLFAARSLLRVETVRRAAAEIKETLNKEVEKVFREVSLAD
ncbi:E3 ubiquitin/ISG15 ligase TRIM25-like [Brachyistius frenatus]|uniref:E3 ubiquitin/ISG15 ligase TRIM25-like n=1 Tax=Brachyistius frenatus TaxID=100188 RepID=UPI0037E7FE11